MKSFGISQAGINTEKAKKKSKVFDGEPYVAPKKLRILSPISYSLA
jgi:hypothetical protein